MPTEIAAKFSSAKVTGNWSRVEYHFAAARTDGKHLDVIERLDHRMAPNGLELTGGPMRGRSPAPGTSALSDGLGVDTFQYSTFNKVYLKEVASDFVSRRR